MLLAKDDVVDCETVLLWFAKENRSRMTMLMFERWCRRMMLVLVDHVLRYGELGCPQWPALGLAVL